MADQSFLAPFVKGGAGIAAICFNRPVAGRKTTE
jgi:hypothetical protein